MKSIFFFIAGFLLSVQLNAQTSIANLSDQKATKKTRNLYAFLSSVKAGQTMFGHQDDFLYGLDWKYNLKSDVEIISGNRPAIVGWDIGNLGHEVNIDSFRFDQIIKGIKYVYRKGGINTISWHMINPLTGGSSWDKEINISKILPGGSAHNAYTKKLDEFANFINKCRVGLFTNIPIIFRPFHEHNGDWFWWGKSHAKEEEYISLWRFTVDYLRNEKNLHNLIFVFSPDRSRMNLTMESYHYGYPGDDYVDIIGLDNYWDMGHPVNTKSPEEQLLDFINSIKLISQIARDKNKVSALTETGNDRITIPNWYTERLLEPLRSNDTDLAWVLVWRNASKQHYFVPDKGHVNEQDFIVFEQDSSTLFLNDIQNPYKKNK
ncbi:glycoside hydrolase family 26 protein [Marinigracilibium pacificum]|uniref:Mannan endo-1,4-beta-mannosidase n=1 Tax=Marinigracilibium pacificum TaxID=2729599 RepID=A0A848IXN5_9BACT|nr:glycosyl hydrolase [Marinigracilibium pacificum]NMM49283.1 beta-mannosidase [Marinigracilibium pacificum]